MAAVRAAKCTYVQIHALNECFASCYHKTISFIDIHYHLLLLLQLLILSILLLILLIIILFLKRSRKRGQENEITK